MTPAILRAWPFDRVRTRLLAAFGALLLAAFALTAVGWLGMRNAQQAVAGFEDALLPNISQALELAERTTQLAALAPKLAESSSKEVLHQNTLAMQSLLDQIRVLTGKLQATQGFGPVLTRWQGEVLRDLDVLLQLTREKQEQQKRFAAQLVQLDRISAELNTGGQAPVMLDPSLATAWSSMVIGIAVDDAALLGRLEADVEVSLLSARRRGVLSRYGESFSGNFSRLAVGSESVLGLRRTLFDLERRTNYLVVLTRDNATELRDEVAVYVANLRAAAAARSDAIRRASRFGESGMLALALVCLAIAIGSARYVRELVGEVENITNVMSRLAQGDTHQPTPATRRRDELGALARTFEVFRDALLSKQKLVADLNSQREMLDAVHNSMTDALAVFDSRQCLLLWNPQLAQLLSAYGIHPRADLSYEDLLKQLPFGSQWVAPGHTSPQPLATARPENFSGFDHVELQLPNGQVLDLRTRAMPGGGAVTLMTDLTARRAIESQLQHAQKLEVLGQLTGGVAHDFNNYLGAILGNLSLLHGRLPDDPAVHTQFARIQRAAGSAAALTRRLLAFARRQPLQAEHVVADDMVEEMRDLIEYSAGPHVQVTLRLGAPGATVYADRGQLENALLNLVLNSAAAMPSGGRLEIATRDADGMVSLDVTDTGTGIPEALQGKVFEPFFTTRSAGEGSGLGLSIVYGFVKQSGGDVSLTSVPGQGTRVCLTFPCAAAPRQASLEAGSTTATLDAFAGLSVLVVDDNTDFRATVVDLLRGAGAQVREESSAEGALASLNSGALPAFVLSDICLGDGLDGLALLHEIQALWPKLPVVLMSGLSPQLLEQRANWDPRAPFLQKPFNLSHLLDRLRWKLEAKSTP